MSFLQNLLSTVTIPLLSSSLTFMDYMKLFILGVCTIYMYYRITKWRKQVVPPPVSVQPRPSSSSTSVNTNTNNAIKNSSTSRSTVNNTPQQPVAPTAASVSKKIPPILSRVPIHLSETSHEIVTLNGSNVLQSSDGCIAFIHTRSSSSSSTSSNTTTTSNNNNTNNLNTECIRRDRAKLLSHLLSSKSTTTTTTTTILPPKRGSTIIVSIPIHTVHCIHQRYILYLLGSYYNTYIILVISSPPSSFTTSTTSTKTTTIQQQQNQLRMNAITTLRGGGCESTSMDIENTFTGATTGMNHNTTTPNIYLSTDIIPSHRIIASTTIEGRIAFIRQQLSTSTSNITNNNNNKTTTTTTLPHLIVDFDMTIQSVLQRFGYHDTIRMYDHHDQHSLNHSDNVPVVENHNDNNGDDNTIGNHPILISGLGRMIL